MSAISNKTPDPAKTWHNSKTLRKRVKFLLGNLDIIPTDITFRVGLKEDAEDFKSHKLILALGSAVFHSMFYGELAESQSVIPVPDVEPVAFKIFQTYLYTDDVVGLDMDNVMEVLYCAKKYQALRLLKHCRHFIQSNLTPECACLINAKAINWDEVQVQQWAVAMISSQTGKVLASPLFLELPEPMLVEFLKCDDLSVGENELYQAVRKWATHNTEHDADPEQALKETMKRLIRNIRVPVMTPSEIANGPGADGVLSESELAQVYTFKFANAKPVIPFPHEERTARPDSIYVNLDLAASFTNDDPDACCGDNEPPHEESIGKIRLEVRCDLAPLYSKRFLWLCNEDHTFTLAYGDVDFVRSDGDTTCLSKESLPMENRLLDYIPGMVAFVVKPGEIMPAVDEIQICHADKTANRGKEGMVFGRVIEGMEVLKLVDSFRDPIWDPKNEHPLTRPLPGVTFFFHNVMVEAEFVGEKRSKGEKKKKKGGEDDSSTDEEDGGMTSEEEEL